MTGEEKTEAGIRKLKEEGHKVEVQMIDGRPWFDIDRNLLASLEQIQGLGDGKYSFTELKEKFRQQKARETAL